MEAPKVIYEDDDLIALAKPAGVVVHHDRTHTAGTVVDWLLAYRPEVRGVGEDPERPGIVHRLDKDTSGVLIVAKNHRAFAHLKHLFQVGAMRKTYYALVVGALQKDRGTIDAPIARSTKNFQKRVVGGKQGRSRGAVTEYRVLERFRDYTLVEAFPKTGRTHQIRSHFAHLGHPLACDALYGGKRFRCPAGLERHFLHARSLSFQTPAGAELALTADVPPDLERVLWELRNES